MIIRFFNDFGFELSANYWLSAKQTFTHAFNRLQFFFKFIFFQICFSHKADIKITFLRDKSKK